MYLWKPIKSKFNVWKEKAPGKQIVNSQNLQFKLKKKVKVLKNEICFQIRNNKILLAIGNYKVTWCKHKLFSEENFLYETE